MDRRQRKTRQAIFSAFTELLSGRNLSGITVGEIIEKADVGRATFYAHFETKDALLDEYCKELFCHIFDAADGHTERHTHIFSCEDTDSPFLHLFRHLYNNDNNIANIITIIPSTVTSKINPLVLSGFTTEVSPSGAT